MMFTQFMSGLSALIALVLIAVAYFIGYQRGKEAVYVEIARESEEAEKKREEIDKDVQSRPDDQLDRDSDKWMRD